MALALELRRIIIFTANMEVMSKFYGDVLGLELVGREEGWLDFKAGACNIALHHGKSRVGGRPPKIQFYVKDVAAARATLVRRGAKEMGKIVSTEKFDMCGGKDPDGNLFGLSARK